MSIACPLYTALRERPDRREQRACHTGVLILRSFRSACRNGAGKALPGAPRSPGKNGAVEDDKSAIQLYAGGACSLSHRQVLSRHAGERFLPQCGHENANPQGRPREDLPR
jgi:hypothetical protein